MMAKSEDKEINLKEKIENNVVIFFLGTLLSGFLAGLFLYDKGLALLNYKVLSEDKLASVRCTHRFFPDETKANFL